MLCPGRYGNQNNMANYPQVFNFSYNEDVRLTPHAFFRLAGLYSGMRLSLNGTLSNHPCIAGGQLPPGGQQASTAEAGHAEIPAQQVRHHRKMLYQAEAIYPATVLGHMRDVRLFSDLSVETEIWTLRAGMFYRFHQQRRDQQQREEMTKHQDRQPRKQQQKRPQFFHRNDQRVRMLQLQNAATRNADYGLASFRNLQKSSMFRLSSLTLQSLRRLLKVAQIHAERCLI